MTVDKFRNFGICLVSGLVGLAAGVCIYSYNDYEDQAGTYEYEGKKIIRTFNAGRNDQIFIQETNNAGAYISLVNHLKTITNKQDRIIERAKIEKLVGQ